MIDYALNEIERLESQIQQELASEEPDKALLNKCANDLYVILDAAQRALAPVAEDYFV